MEPRMVLGAERREVLSMILWEGMQLVGMGLALGLVGALLVTRVMAGLLYGAHGPGPARHHGRSHGRHPQHLISRAMAHPAVWLVTDWPRTPMELRTIPYTWPRGRSYLRTEAMTQSSITHGRD